MKKLLSVVMSIVLVVGLMPLPAYAELAPGSVGGNDGTNLLSASPQQSASDEGINAGGGQGGGAVAGELAAMALGDYVTVDNVDYYYTTATGQGADAVAITAIVTTSETNVVIPGTLTVPVGDGTLSENKTVVALQGNESTRFTDVVGTLESLTIPASVTSIALLNCADYAGTNNK